MSPWRVLLPIVAAALFVLAIGGGDDPPRPPGRNVAPVTTTIAPGG